MENSINAINELMTHDIDELYVELANSDGMVKFGASEGNEETGKALGKAVLSDHIADIRSQMCSHPEVKKFLASDEEIPPRSVILAVLDVILSVLSIVPIFVVTALVLKFGLRKICSGEMPK